MIAAVAAIMFTLGVTQRDGCTVYSITKKVTTASAIGDRSSGMGTSGSGRGRSNKTKTTKTKTTLARMLYIDVNGDGEATALVQRKPELSDLLYFLMKEYPGEYEKLKPRLSVVLKNWKTITGTYYPNKPSFPSRFANRNGFAIQNETNEADRRESWRMVWKSYGRPTLKKVETMLRIVERKNEEMERPKGRR